jgi:hypothetical protein
VWRSAMLFKSYYWMCSQITPYSYLYVYVYIYI